MYSSESKLHPGLWNGMQKLRVYLGPTHLVIGMGIRGNVRHIQMEHKSESL